MKTCSHLNCLVYHPDGVCHCSMARYCGECKKEKAGTTMTNLDKDESTVQKGSMKLLKKPAEYGEAKIGDKVRLLEDFLLIRKGSVGKIVDFIDENGGRIKVEFSLIDVGRVGIYSRIETNDRFIYAKGDRIQFCPRQRDVESP